MLPASPELVAKIEAFAAAHHGRVYAPLDHPDLVHIPTAHGHERRDIVFRHIGDDLVTFLDIGANWGYWSRNLEAAGKEVTAVEHASKEAEFLEEMHRLHQNRFRILYEDVLDMDPIRYDGILAMAVFHHFLKTKRKLERFIAFLGRIDCKVMFFEAHNPQEGQMREAYRNFKPDEFADFIVKNSPLQHREHIGTVGNRRIYKLWQ